MIVRHRTYDRTVRSGCKGGMGRALPSPTRAEGAARMLTPRPCASRFPDEPQNHMTRTTPSVIAPISDDRERMPPLVARESATEGTPFIYRSR